MNNEPCTDARLALCELARRQSNVDAAVYGERRDLDGNEVTGEGEHGEGTMSHACCILLIDERGKN